MAPLSFIGPIKPNTITSSFQPLLFPLNYYYSCSCHHNSISLPRNIVHHVHGNFVPPISHQPFLHRNLLNSERQRGRGTSFIAFDAKKNSSESVGEEEEDDSEALDAVMNKNKNFLSFFQGKTQVLEFFNYVIRILGNHIDIVVKPTLHDGMNIGVRWKFKWEKIHIGKGFRFHIYQNYHGRAVIKNIEMFMLPLLFLVPFRLKMRASLAELVEKIGSFREAKAMAILCIVLAVLFLGALMLFFRKLSS